MVSDFGKNEKLRQAAREGNKSKVLKLIAGGADVNNAKGNHGSTPLHWAGWFDHAAVAKALLANGADVNAKADHGSTPLHWAGRYGRAAVAEVLLANGAEVNAKDKDGWTPLHRSCIINGNAAMVEVLLANGADVNAKNIDGKTPCDLASSNGHAHVIKVLDNAPTSPNAFDNNNANSDTGKVGAATGKFPPSRPIPGDAGGPSPALDGAGKIPDRAAAQGEPPARISAPSSSPGGAGGERPRAELTDDDFAFLAMGRELVRDGTNKIPVISREEQNALQDLATKMVDIERSLESVRELPSSLSGRGPEISEYFFFFTGAFERAHVAAQALSSGAVKVQLDLSLEALLVGTGWVAENCGLPFAGCISIFTAIMAHQQSTKKTNTFVAFEEFFRGNSRDQYLLTHRKLGEQFSLQLDMSSLAESDPGKTSKLKERVKSNVVAPIRKYLQKNHLDALQKLSPIEEKAMSDLASLTKEVLRLHKDEHDTYHKLRASNEDDKASYFVRHIFGKPLKSVRPKQNMNGTGTAQSTNHSDGDTGATMRPMSEKMKSLKNLSDANANALSANADLAQEFEQVKAQVRQLAAKLKSQEDVTVPSGRQAQVQMNPDKPKEAHSRQLEQFETALVRVEEEIHQMQTQQEKQSRDVEKMKLEHFINNRFLSYHEAFEFTQTIISMVRISDGDKIEVSDRGKFVYDCKNYCIGEVGRGTFLSKRRSIWKGKVKIKLEAEHQGVKSVMEWFDETKLRPFYERNKKEAILAVFAEELQSEPLPADMVQPYRYHDQEGDREKLGI